MDNEKITLATNFKAPFGPLPALRLMYVSRWGIISMDRKQSVAEHSYNVALITDYICDKLGWYGSRRLEAIEIALIHDTDEVYTGDVPSPAKISIKKDLCEYDVIVKVADCIEAINYVNAHCNDTKKVKKWVLHKLGKCLHETIALNDDLHYSNIEKLLEDR